VRSRAACKDRRKGYRSAVSSPSSRPGPAAAAATLRKLQAVTDAALAHLSLEELLDELLTRVRDALEADTCAVLLLDETGDELVARAAKGLEEEVEQRVRIPYGQGFAGRVVAERRPVVIPDLDRAQVVNPILRDKGLKSLLGVPLVAHGNVLGVIHVGALQARDFTPDDVELLQIVAERVALAVERALVHDELMRLTQVQRDFVALAAHELRNPAASVYGLATTLRARYADLSEDRIVVIQETLYQQAERMRRLVEQLLDLSRLDSLTVEVSPRRVQLRPTLEEIVGSVVGQGAGDVALDVPAELEAIVDPTALERIVTNLVTNALRYGSPPVRVSAEQADRHLRISVEDEGGGVPADFVPHLFERFQRGEESRRQVGTGLGLAIARAYARAHGGDLVYEPLEPSGARFQLVLPTNGNGGNGNGG
jgi:signal transduction histidine kinase